MGKKAPKAPNPATTAKAQAQYSKEAAKDQLRLNALDQTGPFGQATFDRDETGLPTGINTSLSDQLQSGAGNISSAYADLSGGLPTSNFDSTMAVPDTSAISQDFYDRGAGLLEHPFSQQRKQHEVRLAERGLPLGSEAEYDASRSLNDSQNLAYQQLASQAALQAPAEQQRLIGNARQDYLQPGNVMSNYGSNLGLLKGLTPGASQPTAGIQAPNYSGLVQQKYQADMDRYNSKMGGLGQLVSTGVGLLGAPFTGGASLGLSGLGGLFGGGGGGSTYGSSWAPMTTNQYGAII